MFKSQPCPLCGVLFKNHAKCGMCSLLLHDNNRDELNWWLCKKCAETMYVKRSSIIISLNLLNSMEEDKKEETSTEEVVEEEKAEEEVKEEVEEGEEKKEE